MLVSTLCPSKEVPAFYAKISPDELVLIWFGCVYFALVQVIFNNLNHFIIPIFFKLLVHLKELYHMLWEHQACLSPTYKIAIVEVDLFIQQEFIVHWVPDIVLGFGGKMKNRNKSGPCSLRLIVSKGRQLKYSTH